MRYITVITILLGIGGCTAISDFAGYTFDEKYDPDGGAAGAAGWYDPYQGYAGAAGAVEPLGGQGGQEWPQAGQGGAAGGLEPLAGQGGAAGEPWVEPDAGQVEPESDAGQAEPDAGVDPEPDAGQIEPDTSLCQPCIDSTDCRNEVGGSVSCTALYADGSGPMVCLMRTGVCPYDLVVRPEDDMCVPGVGCLGWCVPQDGDCEAWLEARGF